ncbi:MAG: tRNA (adenosine(37)-N6)-dimethylallyltransferase MiaA [Bacteroidia bacterium]
MHQKIPESATLISIVGPTAVGKTSLSIALARHWKTAIVNCDARQVYRHLDIGTAKPNASELAAAPHYLIDILDPSDPYNAQLFSKDTETVLGEIFEKNPVAVAVGGSTLYANALWSEMDSMPQTDPEARAQLHAIFEREGIEVLQQELAQVDPQTWMEIDQHNPARIIRALEVFRSSGKPISHFRTGKLKEKPWRNVKCCLNLEPRELLYARINLRVDMMLEAGLVEEIKALLDGGLPAGAPGLNAIGYQELIPYFENKRSLDEAVSLIKRNSRRYAKRQLTWWRREADIHWLDAGKGLEELVQQVTALV